MIFQSKYPTVPCSSADVDKHYEQIKHWITDTGEQVFKQRMHACIAAGTAYKALDCFLYYLPQTKRYAHGIAIFNGSYPQNLLALFENVFLGYDQKTQVLQFQLHNGKFVDEYRSLLTRKSIKGYLLNKTPVTVRIDAMRKKYTKLHQARS
jgi:hypothetical protein